MFTSYIACTSPEAYRNNKFYEQRFTIKTIQNWLRHFIENEKSLVAQEVNDRSPETQHASNKGHVTPK